MATITTNPSPVITNQLATLFYTNTYPIPIPGDTYVLQLGGSSVSNTYTGVSPTENIISSNVVLTGATTSSSCVYYNGNIYTSMEYSGIPNNGYIQKTDPSGNSTVYFQFNLSANPPVPDPNPYGPNQFPTGLSIDSNGNLYFLVFGNNNVYKISDLNNPTSYVKYNTTDSAISAPYHMAINLNNNFLYISATNPTLGSYYIEQINTSGVTSQLSGYTFTEASYGICCDLSDNLYIGYDSGVIGKYDLNNGIFTSNFYTIQGEGKVYGLIYIAVSNSLIANVGSNGNIYTISITPINSTLIKNSSGILGNFGYSGTNIIYGTTSSQIISYTFNQTFTFNNLLLSQPSNLLSLYNQTTSQTIDTFNVNTTGQINPQTFYKVGGVDLSNIFQPYTPGTTQAISTGITVSGVDLNQLFAPYVSGDLAAPTGYTVEGHGDLNQIFAKYNPVPFTTTGTYEYVSGYGYYITFTTTGTIIFNTSISNVSIICVGGGGGGGGGSSQASGRGGGGGGNYLSGGGSISEHVTYFVSVGLGGPNGLNGDGQPGGDSSVTVSTVTFLKCSGGGGGSLGSSPGPGAGGTVITGGSGGSGGSGGNQNFYGESSASHGQPFTIPSPLISYINSSYCGGGGGSSGQNAKGGAPGLNGAGGAAYGSPNYSGGDASSYGSGGGGGGGGQPSGTKGGKGAPGVVIFYFPYS